ncbi:hypothetical protein Tco_0860803 [Tanacetum coccineum]|uniref:DUF4283 domain-containing protein n=1 Tax=Tanacetum coccineum TaxID=301880 RepID=A0ABQ5BFZ5_9ASTR
MDLIRMKQLIVRMNIMKLRLRKLGKKCLMNVLRKLGDSSLKSLEKDCENNESAKEGDTDENKENEFQCNQYDVNKNVKSTYASKLYMDHENVDNKLCHIPTILEENGYEFVIFDEEIVKFNNLQGLQTIIENGPWILNHKQMIVQRDGTKFVKSAKVEYGWKPPMCEHCHVFGHSERKCKSKERPRMSLMGRICMRIDAVVKTGSRRCRNNPEAVAPSNLPRVSLRRLQADAVTNILTSSLAIPDVVASFGNAVFTVCLQFLQESWCRVVVLSVSSPNEPKSRVFSPKAIQMLKTLKSI